MQSFEKRNNIEQAGALLHELGYDAAWGAKPTQAVVLIDLLEGLRDAVKKFAAEPDPAKTEWLADLTGRVRFRGVSLVKTAAIERASQGKETMALKDAADFAKFERALVGVQNWVERSTRTETLYRMTSKEGLATALGELETMVAAMRAALDLLEIA